MTIQKKPYLSVQPVTMLKNLFYLALLAITVSSCSGNGAYKYNQAIYRIDQQVAADAEPFYDKISNHMQNGEYDSMALVADKLEKIADDALQKIKKIPIPDAKGADMLSAKTVRYFEQIKNVFTVYKKIATAPNEEIRATHQEQLTNSSQEMSDVMKSLQEEQAKFAKANGFRIEDKD
jgi:hypothetical protein